MSRRWSLRQISFCVGIAIIFPAVLIERLYLQLLDPFSVWQNECQNLNYNVRIISYDPLMIHLENFITPRERRHLLNLASPNLKRATVEFTNGSRQETTIRTSSVAMLDNTDTDPTVQCLMRRLAVFQGEIPLQAIERMQVTTYAPGQHYGAHVDSLGSLSQHNSNRWSRATTTFGILDATCEKCGTQFPSLRTNWTNAWGTNWCRILDCEEDVLTVNPIPGNALFWWNLQQDGSPDLRTIHTGMPVTSGSKAGVNVWTKLDPAENVIR